MKYCIKLINYNTLTELFFEADYSKEEFEYYFTHAMSYPIWYIADNFERIMRMRGAKYQNFSSSVRKITMEDCGIYKNICCNGQMDINLIDQVEYYFLFDVNDKEDKNCSPYILISKISQDKENLTVSTILQYYNNTKKVFLYKTTDNNTVSKIEDCEECLISNIQLTRMLEILFNIDNIKCLEDLRRE